MSFDPDADDYILAVESTQSAYLPMFVKAAIDALVRGCKADESPVVGVSNWDAMKACCLLAGPQTIEAALVPLKGPAPTPSATGTASYSRTLGLAASSGFYLATGRLNNADPQNNRHIAIYITEPHAITVNRVYMGVWQHSCIATSGVTDLRTSLLRSAAGLDATFAAASSIAGFAGISRSSSSAVVSRAIGQTQTIASTSRLPGSEPINVFNNENFTRHVGARLSYYSSGESVEQVSLDFRLREYMRAIYAGDSGRGFPLSRLVN